MRSGCSSSYGIQCLVGVCRRSRHRDSSHYRIKITENETGTLVAGSLCTITLEWPRDYQVLSLMMATLTYIYCIYTAFVSVSYEIFILKIIDRAVARVQL
jgi:hypothetical protein